MKTTWELPEGYVQRDYFNFRKDRQRYRRLNLLSGLIGLVMVIIAWRAEGFHALSRLLLEGFTDYYLWLAILVCAMLLYATLHELTHGLMLRALTGQVDFARKGLRLYAGSQAYLCSRDYLLSLLTPAVFWGILLGIACCFAPGVWFWLFYALEIMNLGGSVGDFYLAAQCRRLPKTALYQNFGMSVYVYTEEI